MQQKLHPELFFWRIDMNLSIVEGIDENLNLRCKFLTENIVTLEILDYIILNSFSKKLEKKFS